MKDSSHEIGGKAHGLNVLKHAGCRVPAFVALSASLFEPFLREDYTLREGWEKSEAIVRAQEVLAEAELFAVRSSALGEDGKLHAHPGMCDTLTKVKPENLLTAIEKVVQSAGSSRVYAYRSNLGLSSRLKPAVVIQEWIEADQSGVLFTTYPSYPNELLIHSVDGPGEALVQGELDPAEVAFDKSSQQVYWSHIPAGETSLSNVLLQELYDTSTRLEADLGYPLDIEFCIVKDQIYWLQLRPITTTAVDQIVLDNANIQESYCGVTSELSFSFAQRAYETVYRQTMLTLGLSRSKVESQKEVVENLLYHHQGRVYYNINNWYKGLQLLPSFRQNKSDLERMMGLENPVSFVVNSQLTVWQMLRRLPSLSINAIRLLLAFRRLPKDTIRFKEHFENVFERFQNGDPNHFSEEDCKLWYDTLNNELLERWEVPIINDFYVMMKNGKAHRRLEKMGVSDPDVWLQDNLHHESTLPSMAPMLGLQSLAHEAKGQKDLLEELRAGRPDLFERLSNRYPEFYASIQAYIKQYGDRVMGELKMECVTMRVDPFLLLRYLRPMLDQESSFSVSSSSKESPSWIAPLRDGIFRREALRLQRTRLFGMYRSINRRMEAMLLAKGILEQPNDIFLWRIEELEAYWQSGQVVSKADLLSRRAQFVKWQADEPPGRVYLPGRVLTSTLASADDTDWQGQAAVAGQAEGEVVCVSGPDDYAPLEGKILCALRTDPGWVPLFPGCKGIIIERGSSLSHSVIVLRELGIPTIINVSGITQALSTGDKVRIDGSTGKIERS